MTDDFVFLQHLNPLSPESVGYRRLLLYASQLRCHMYGIHPLPTETEDIPRFADNLCPCPVPMVELVSCRVSPSSNFCDLQEKCNYFYFKSRFFNLTRDASSNSLQLLVATNNGFSENTMLGGYSLHLQWYVS